MECSSLYNKNSVNGTLAFFPRTPENINCHTFPSTCSFPLNSTNPFATLSSSSAVKCYGQNYGDEEALSTSLAYDVLGVAPNCSADELKSAFRNKMLSNFTKSEIIERECLDPFDQPECEAFDLFVNETVCIGKGCQFSCVKKAPHAFTFSSLTGTAQATSQGHGEDYQVHLAAGQCPRSCIHYVTPSQRIVLEELLGSIMSTPYDTSAEADLLYSLIVKARFENNRYQKPKKQPKASTKHVDWF
uniref:Pentatricopeptide repeat-containing protein n=1 Tax=Solanum tuberosum TaxID=4113 RepID=M1CAQ7_SOLTU